LLVLDKLTEKAKDVLLELSKNNSSSKDAKSVLEVITNSAGIGNVLIRNLPKFKIDLNTSIDLNTLVQEAFYQSFKLKTSYVGTEHLLLALLKLSGVVNLNPYIKELSKLNSFPSFVKIVESQKRTPVLDAFGLNLNKKILSEDQKLLARNEVDVLVSILLQKDNFSPLIVGDLGVGKRSLVELFVKRLVENEVPSVLLDTTVFEIDIVGFISSFSNKDGLEYGISSLTEELENFDKVILYFKNFQSIFVPTQGGLTVPLAFSMIHDQLKELNVKIISVMNTPVYEKVVAENEHVLDGFSTLVLEEPNEELNKKIIREKLLDLTKFHNIKVSENVPSYALEKALDLKNTRFPKKSVDLLDQAFTKVLLKNSKVPLKHKNLIKKKNVLLHDFNSFIDESSFSEALRIKTKLDKLNTRLDDSYNSIKSSRNLILTTDEIDEVLDDMGNLRIGLKNQDFSYLSNLSKNLKKIIIGQDCAIDTVVKSLIKSKLGLRNSKKPLGNFLFLGPTGVGKTEFAKALSTEFYGPNSLIRLDMSDFAEKHSIARLVGAPPGYIGYGEGGELTEKIDKNPASVVLFDEIEKAHPDVLNILLQIMEEGELVDAKGQTFDFSKAVVVLTSNLGTEFFHKNQIGLTKETLSKENSEVKLLDNLKKVMRPELINRFDELVVFHQLNREDVVYILDKQLHELIGNLRKQKIDLIISQNVNDILIEKGFSKEYGVRALKRIIDKNLINLIAEVLLENTQRPLKLKAVEKDSKIQIIIR